MSPSCFLHNTEQCLVDGEFHRIILSLYTSGRCPILQYPCHTQDIACCFACQHCQHTLVTCHWAPCTEVPCNFGGKAAAPEGLLGVQLLQQLLLQALVQLGHLLVQVSQHAHALLHLQLRSHGQRHSTQPREGRFYKAGRDPDCPGAAQSLLRRQARLGHLLLQVCQRAHSLVRCRLSSCVAPLGQPALPETHANAAHQQSAARRQAPIRHAWRGHSDPKRVPHMLIGHRLSLTMIIRERRGMK